MDSSPRTSKAHFGDAAVTQPDHKGRDGQQKKIVRIAKGWEELLHVAVGWILCHQNSRRSMRRMQLYERWRKGPSGSAIRC